MVTFMILMRIERVEGASDYLTKAKVLVLHQLGYQAPKDKDGGWSNLITCGSSELAEWQ